MEGESMLFVMNHIPYLRGILNSFSNSFFDFYGCEVVSSSDVRQMKHKASNLCIHNAINMKLKVTSCSKNTTLQVVIN